MKIRFTLIMCILLFQVCQVHGQKTEAPTKDLKSKKEVVALAKAVASTIMDRKLKPVAGVIDPNPQNRIDDFAAKLGFVALSSIYFPDATRGLENRFAAAVETRREDKQIGAAAGAGGSTSLTEKTGIAKLLGLAIENGAVTQDVSGTTMTLSTSPYAVAAWIDGDTSSTYARYGAYSRLGISASFNVSDSSDPLQSATRQQLSQWEAKFRLLGDQSPRSSAAKAIFDAKVLPELQKVAAAQTEGESTLFMTASRNSKLQTFENDAKAALASLFSTASLNTEADKASFVDQAANAILDALQTDIADQSDSLALSEDEKQRLKQAAQKFASAVDSYFQSSTDFDAALKSLQEQQNATLSYLYKVQSALSDYSMVTFLYAKKPGDFATITLNISGSFYHRPDPTKNQETFRNFIAALELRQDLGRSPFAAHQLDKSTITLSFSGRYERMPENAHQPGQKADLGFANVKLDIPIAAGVSLPLSVTYGNSSEVKAESFVRGNFGLSFDLDKLYALVKH